MPGWLRTLLLILGGLGGIWVLYWVIEKLITRRKEQRRREDEALQLCNSIKEKLDGLLGRRELPYNSKENDSNKLLQSIKEKLSGIQK